MVSGAEVVQLLGNGGDVVDFTISDNASVNKGDLMFVTDGMVASGSHATTKGSAFAGIAAADKEASDGATTIGLWTKGIFDIVTGAGGVKVGEVMILSGANAVTSGASVVSASALSQKVGICMDTEATGSSIEVAVGVY